MSTIPPLFLGVTLLAAFLASVSIWSPRRTGMKVSALVAACLLLPVAWVAFVELLSRPKPVGLEWLQSQEATVLSSSFAEGKGIYLWLRLDGADEPRAYVMPWDQHAAEELQEASRRGDGGVRMRLPFEPSLDDRAPRFYAMPQPALPPKDGGSRPAADVDALARDA